MAAITKGGPHGLLKVMAQRVSSVGISMGQTGESLAAGSNSNAYMLNYPKTANVAVPDRTTIDFTGGDAWITSFQYGISSLGSFDFTIQDEDADFNALCTGTLVDETSNAEWAEYTYDELGQDRPQISLMFTYRIQSFERSTFGQTYYVNTVVPRCWCAPKGNQQQYQTVGEPTYQVTPASSSRKINGELFGANLNATNNVVSAYRIITRNPLWMAVGVADDTSISVVSAYQPVTSAVGSAGDTKNYVVRYRPSTDTATAGVADTITPATGTFAVGSALTVAADDIVMVLHETAYTEVA